MKKLQLLLIVLIFSSGALHAQEGAFNIRTNQQLSEEEWKANLPEKFALFEKEELLEITFESDFKNFNRRKYKDEYQLAMLQYQLNDSILVKRQIKIKPRGEFRKRYCYFPPIKLKFSKTDFFVEDLQQLDKMKMVTNCKAGSTFEQYLLKEYLTYKLYNLLTEKSFQVRLIKVKYIDTGRKNKTNESFAFLIEEADQMARRNNSVLMDNERVSQKSTEPEQMNMAAVFQFMIGNTDWTVPLLHNMKLIKTLDIQHPHPFAVPYDFDYSGLVNAEYAIPHEDFGIETVRDRLFRGDCRTEEEFQKTFVLFKDRKEDFYQTIKSLPYLNDREKNDMIDFLDGFYEIINNPRDVKAYFVEACRD